MFDNNFGKCDRVSKYFHLPIREQILYVTHKDFHLTCDMLPCESLKSKNVADFDNILNKLLAYVPKDTLIA